MIYDKIMYLNPAHQSVKSCARYPWSIFQTCSGPLITKKVPDKVTGTFFCAIISLYGRYPEYVAVIYISIKQLIYNKISAEQIKDGFWFRFFPGYRLWLSEVK